MEELPNNSRSNSEAASRRLLSEDPSSSGAVQPGFVRNVFFTGSAQASVDSTSSDSSDCSALAGPSAERPGSACSAPCSSPGAQAAPASCAQGPKFKLTHEGDLQLCRLNHSRTVISKILSSKFLRRWEAHKILLGTAEMASKTFMKFSKKLFTAFIFLLLFIEDSIGAVG
ncbi:hypothetical protein IscW_ISCW006406 [Ixodes scapularis]|uniref:C-Maf-inducing protein PH domain-containing protein n=1 Tax=Ixodes scapularis TaxID=6945 RepID=B7PMJ4_IXOSC|nr:hypothetical protein IscW_ISCW006406 [Ixodes scapularis]|eukprot:XP_002434992.1 hypothetical protein IscW_ISCW006406 [Ixodes scapularis]